jgi:SPP1 family predicted phage head-tail adaptor
MSIYTSNLDDTVDIKTRSISDTNDWGEPSHTWTTESDIECKVFMVTHDETKEMEGEWDNIKYKIYFKYSQTINVEDRITYESNEYEVIKVYESVDEQFKRVLVKEL